jgi:hypothetical protein
MSIVGDLREALQDVVAPDLKAVVRGLADLKEEVRSTATLLRDEMSASERRSRERTEESESRIVERLDRIYDAVKISDLTRRNAELEIELEQLRKARQH